jgi:hypothetical protein
MRRLMAAILGVLLAAVAATAAPTTFGGPLPGSGGENQAPLWRDEPPQGP